jgi:hypothetical protein
MRRSRQPRQTIGTHPRIRVLHPWQLQPPMPAPAPLIDQEGEAAIRPPSPVGRPYGTVTQYPVNVTSASQLPRLSLAKNWI